MRYHYPVNLAPQVKEALRQGRPVVALESTVITHGLPHPRNLELARELEETVREAGAVPATIGLVDGIPTVGLDAGQLERLATEPAQKASLWNLTALMATGASAGTTVATTLHFAHASGIRVFATGGIGGVHNEPFDESADLQALTRYRVITVCAGPKSILDAPATMERLESLGVPVVGYRSDRLAGFHVPLTDLPVPVTLETPAQIARAFSLHAGLDLPGGMLISNPVSDGLHREELASYLSAAHREAQERSLSGKDVTPFLLARLAELSEGRTVDVNVRLLKENAQLAARIAVEAAREGSPI